MIKIFIKISYGMDADPERINDGASTSHELNVHEECELWSYVDSIVRLMTAEDADGGNLTDIVNNRFYELEAFHTEIFSNLNLAEFGAQFISDADRRSERVEYVIYYSTMKLLEIIVNSCIEHRRFKSEYSYDSENNVITVKESTNLPSDECLCGNYGERRILNEEFSLPVVERPSQFFQLNIHTNGVSMIEVVEYHIIPLSMLSKFFQLWLSDDENLSDIGYNRCVLTLIGRLKRSMQKLIIVRTKHSERLSIDIHKILLNLANNPFTNKTNEDSYDWLAGNIFFGPSNRGPFHPEILSNREESFRAFEYDVVDIIGSNHYVIMEQLYNQLLFFINQVSVWSPHERLLNGFQIFLVMIIRLSQWDVTPFNRDQWEELEPTDYDLEEVENDLLRREFRAQKYWAIKKQSRRFPRSKNSYFSESQTFKNLTIRQIKNRWRKFITNLLKIFINSNSRNESLIWSCDLIRLYNNYILHSSDIVNGNCATFKGFDDYLFSVLESSLDWHRCNNLNVSIIKTHWCQAWRRILKYDFNLTWMYDEKTKENQQFLPKSYLTDVKTLMQWLPTTESFKNCQNSDGMNLVTLSNNNPYQNSYQRHSVIDTTLCYLSTVIVNLITFKNNCHNF